MCCFGESSYNKEGQEGTKLPFFSLFLSARHAPDAPLREYPAMCGIMWRKKFVVRCICVFWAELYSDRTVISKVHKFGVKFTVVAEFL